MRPTLARISSAASGLRFCGMIEEPVENRSEMCHETELRRGPDHQLFGHAAQMPGADRGAGQELQREIPVAETASSEFAVKAGRSPALPQSRPGRSGRTSRPAPPRPSGHSFIRARASANRCPVAAEHLYIGHHVMAPGHRLRCLQMGEAGHHHIRAGLGLIQQRPDQRRDSAASASSIRSRTHSLKSVATWSFRDRACVQPPRRVADQLAQPRLHIHVDVFQRLGKPVTSPASISDKTVRRPLSISSASFSEIIPC